MVFFWRGPALKFDVSGFGVQEAPRTQKTHTQVSKIVPGPQTWALLLWAQALLFRARTEPFCFEPWLLFRALARSCIPTCVPEKVPVTTLPEHVWEFPCVARYRPGHKALALLFWAQAFLFRARAGPFCFEPWRVFL